MRIVLYQWLRLQIVGYILDHCRDGDQVPSVRSFAAKHEANPLTVAKAYDPLVRRGIIEARRGVGMFVRPGGVARLRAQEKAWFLSETWPALRREADRLSLDVNSLVQKALGSELTDS